MVGVTGSIPVAPTIFSDQPSPTCRVPFASHRESTYAAVLVTDEAR